MTKSLALLADAFHYVGLIATLRPPQEYTILIVGQQMNDMIGFMVALAAIVVSAVPWFQKDKCATYTTPGHRLTTF